MNDVKKKKIRTLTFHRVLNYGAVLQSYALVKTLNKMGYECEVANYSPFYFLYQIYRPAKGFKKSYDKFLKIVRFTQFRRKYLPISKKLFFTASSVGKEKNIHAYLCGSDQVWNRKITNGEFDDAFFMNFEAGGARKIAYAASAGGSALGNSNKIRRLLNTYHSIGVRETILQEELQGLNLNSEVVTVLDPSLLIKDYTEIMDFNRVPEGDFLLTYAVGSGDTLSNFDSHVAKLKQGLDIPVVHIGSKDIESADISILNIGPSDWVAFFEKAKYIATNSFHGTAFAVNFQKQFLFIPHILEALNERQNTLLEGVGLTGRKVSSVDHCVLADFDDIDYSEITPRLEIIVDKSKAFLKESLA